MAVAHDSLERTIIENHLIAGVFVRGAGGVTALTGANIRAILEIDVGGGIIVNGNAVLVSDVANSGGTGVTLTSNSFSNNDDIHVLLHASNATLSDNTYVGPSTTLQQQSCTSSSNIVTSDTSADGLSGTEVIFPSPYDLIVGATITLGLAESPVLN